MYLAKDKMPDELTTILAPLIRAGHEVLTVLAEIQVQDPPTVSLQGLPSLVNLSWVQALETTLQL